MPDLSGVIRGVLCCNTIGCLIYKALSGVVFYYHIMADLQGIIRGCVVISHDG